MFILLFKSVTDMSQIAGVCRVKLFLTLSFQLILIFINGRNEQIYERCFYGSLLTFYLSAFML